MGINALVYDNQSGYYEMLKAEFRKGFIFSLLSASTTDLASNDYDIMIFFLHDELEYMDFLKLYDNDVPMILGASFTQINHNLPAQNNIYYVNLDLLKDEIIEKVGEIFDLVGDKKKPLQM